MKPPLKWIFGTLFRLPAWMLHLNNHKILEDDNIFLHQQMHHYRACDDILQQGIYLPTQSDAVVAAFQRWLKDYGVQDRMWSPHTPLHAFETGQEMLSRHDLITRGATHTDCVSCQKAKSWLQRVEPALSVASILLAIRAIAGRSGVRWLPALMAAIAYFGKRKATATIRAMEVGEWPPLRNRS